MSDDLLGGDPSETFKKILIPMIRKTLPSLIAADICGVQPMTGPTGLIFSMKAKYGGVKMAQSSSTYDDWLTRTGYPDTAATIDVYLDELLED